MNTDFDERLIDRLGRELHAALVSRQPLPPLSLANPGLTIETAYRVQERMIARRLAAGDHVVGKKIGVTSGAVMAMLGVNQPDFGHMLASMRYEDHAVITRDILIQPKAEGEIAFVMARDLEGPGITPGDVLAATESVVTCFEIVDSRIRDWKITIEDTIADNASCGVFVLGVKHVDPRSVDLANCRMSLEKNGSVVVTGRGDATMGSPLNAVAWLANTLGSLGVPLRAGEVVLSGALGAMVPVTSGDSLRVAIEGIGEASVSFI